MACRPIATVQSQYVEAYQWSAINLRASENSSFVKQSESELYTVWKCFNIHLILIASLFMQREESAEKSNENGKMLFIWKCWGHWQLTLPFTYR